MGKGDGPVAKKGDTLSIKAVGYVLEQGKLKQFWDTGNTPFSFKMGDMKVVIGLELAAQTLMRGSKARFLMVPSMGYGAAGKTDNGIPPNAILVYNVEVLQLQH